jgi:hypothetical protein
MEQATLWSVSIVVSVLLTWLVTSASMRWGRGRGLVRRPATVRMENTERLWQAKNQRAQGCREMLRALGQFLLAAILVFLLALLLGGYVGR